MSAHTSPAPAVPWRVVVPVKDTRLGKSRLQPPDGVPRNLLAMSLALDTINAVRHCLGAAAVVVVTSDAALESHARAWEIPVVPESALRQHGQLADRLRQRGLRHVEPLGRSPEVARLGHGGEVAQVSQLHEGPPSVERW